MICMLFSILIISACQDSSSEAQTSSGIFKTISKVDFAKRMEEQPVHLLIDVRTPSEYARGTINTAKNVDWNSVNFEAEISKLDKSKPVFIFCQKGGRSGKALSKIKRLGFNEVYDLQGGYSGWEK